MSIILDGTNGITNSSWTTATRPTSPSTGQMGYNTTTGQIEVYSAISGWVNAGTAGNFYTSSYLIVAGGGGGGGSTTNYSGGGGGGAGGLLSGTTTFTIGTTYTVTVTNAKGCTDDDIVIVSVNPIVVAYAGKDTAICKGITPTLKAPDFITFLQEILKNFSGERLYLVLDNARVHHANIVRDYIKSTRGNLNLIFLPPYSAELNPIERFWEFLRKEKTHNAFYPTFEEFQDTIKEYISEFAIPQGTIKTLCDYYDFPIKA